MTNFADRFALQDVMTDYAAGVDERDFTRHRECFADGVEVVGFTRQPIRGIDAWLDFVAKALENYVATQHLLGLQHAVVDGDQAHARTDVQAQHFLKSPRGAMLTIWATYETDFERIEGRWRIARHRFVPRGRWQTNGFAEVSR
jgi:ketosteroid isomerase-like protein